MIDKSHILVVEDDPLVCDVLSAALDECYLTTTVGTSRDALDRLRQGGIDLVLLDCTLPDGVHESLIPHADETGVPVVLMSGDPARMERLTTPARTCVTKPFTITALLATVEGAIAAKAGAS